MTFVRSIFLLVLVTTLVCEANSTELDDFRTLAVANLRASLKPLTPIAGTNLFLNTPYKWHDHTKPGCYATWFMEKYQAWFEKFRGVRMVCNNDDQQWYNTEDADWIFERTEGQDSIDEYGGKVKIFNIGSKDTLETWKSAGTWWVGLGRYAANPAEDMWSVQIDPSNRNHLQLEIQNWFLAQTSAPNQQTYAYLSNGNSAGFPYSFVPAVDIEAKMYNFEFSPPNDELLAKHTTRKGLIDTYTINNDSPASLSRKITVSEKVTNEFSWGFSESLKTCTKVTGSAGIPLLAEGTVEASLDLQFDANQNWKNSVEKSFEMSYDVAVPPKSQVTVSAWYDLIDDISMDYTAKTEITGKTTRMTVFNDMVKDSPATGAMIRSQLDLSNFDGTIVEVKENSVIAQIKGTMIASIGVRGQLNVNGANVDQTEIPAATIKSNNV